MTNYIRGYCERGAESADTGPIRFVASTEHVGRDGLVIEAAGWQLDAFRANPVVLWGHDYQGQRLPIGKADVEVDGKRLMADVTFDPGDEFAQQVERKYRTGFLNAVSVGWDTKELAPSDGTGASRVTKAELLDISAVPVPGDPHALKERQLRGIADLVTQFDDLVYHAGDPTSEEAGWIGTACRMARLVLADANDAERERTYRVVARDYERLGRTAPELLPVASLRAMTADQLRSLFLEGEPDLLPEFFDGQRAGAVLSQRNHNDLTEAVRLIEGVLERALRPDPEPEPETESRTSADDALVRIAAMLKGASNV